MKSFFKKPTKTKQSNLLIDYTKWLFKILFLGAAIIGILLYFLIIYENNKESDRNILFTLDCELTSFDKEMVVNQSDDELIGKKAMIQGVGFESGRLWYIERLNEAMYINESNSFKPDYIDIGEPEWFEPEKGLYKGDYYFSGVLGGEWWFIVNRVNLTASIYVPKKTDKYNKPISFITLISYQCNQISEKEYKKASDDLKKSIQKERKI